MTKTVDNYWVKKETKFNAYKELWTKTFGEESWGNTI